MKLYYCLLPALVTALQRNVILNTVGNNKKSCDRHRGELTALLCGGCALGPRIEAAAVPESSSR